MAKEIPFAGDDLQLLATLDRAGCVLTDDGEFYCDPEKSGLSCGSRLPVCIKGTYRRTDGHWILRFRVVPARKTLIIGVIFAVLFLASLASFAVTGGSLAGSALFGVLNAAVAVNYAVQAQDCMKRFEKTVCRM